MKKRIGLMYALACLLVSCGRHDTNTEISYRDKSNSYSMDARFSKNKMLSIEHFMNDAIGKKNNFSFLNTETDAVISLNDGTTFYMRKEPGHLKIKLDKDKNSTRSYYVVKSMCEDIKDVIQNK